MTQDTPAPTPSGRSWTGWLLWACFILFIAYPLSTGPAISLWVATDSASLRHSIEAFYAPLEVLSENCEPAEDFFQWYIGTLWGVP
jgi:hypothetical protein